MSDKNLNALKTLVISMGVVLILGFVTVAAAVWMKMNSGTGMQQGGIPANCKGGDLDLKGRGHIIDTAVEGTVLRVALDNGKGQIEVVHVDICSGRELTSLKIQTDATEAEGPVSGMPLPPRPFTPVLGDREHDDPPPLNPEDKPE